MAFSPVSLPIQEILLTNFVTDIATISNANDLLLQDKLEDLINLMEIDLNTLAIVDSPPSSPSTVPRPPSITIATPTGLVGSSPDADSTVKYSFFL